MRHLAVVLAAALVFTMIAPAFAQPFSDVPTNHWAYDAIAELAAKGLVEGYPDGTFRGDRTVTRYEMAMIVARLLARVESIQIPTPAAPQVTRTDVASIQRLVNEFRAELAALGVRVTAIEEELNAIKAKMDNVRITGAFRLRYDAERKGTGTGTGGNLNPQLFANDASGNAQPFRARMGFKLILDGSVAPDVHLIGALVAGSGSPGSLGTSTPLTFNSSNYGLSSQDTLASIDNLFFDWKNAFGWPVEFWIGRFGGNGIPFGQHPIQYGPFGLLLNTPDSNYQDSTADTHSSSVDGLAMFGHWSALADLQVQALIARVVGGVGSGSYNIGEDVYGVDANVQVLPGLRVGGYYVANNIYNPGGVFPANQVPAPNGANWHLYGPAGGSVNPPTTHCLLVAAGASPSTNGATGGIQCPALGSGGGGYVGWDILSGIHFDGEIATWSDGVLGGSDTGYQVNVVWDLGTLMGLGHNLTLGTGYNNFGVNFIPPYGGGADDFVGSGANVVYPGNVQGFLGTIGFDPVNKWHLYANYYGGSTVSNALPVSEYEAGLQYTGLAPNTKLSFLVFEFRYNSIEQNLHYRTQLDYRF